MSMVSAVAENGTFAVPPADITQTATLASGDPYYEEMLDALRAFDRDGGLLAPPRDRAFFAALRSLLSESSMMPNADQRRLQLTAAFKWFSKHRPTGLVTDPATTATLAASLAVPAPTRPVANPYGSSRLTSGRNGSARPMAALVNPPTTTYANSHVYSSLPVVPVTVLSEQAGPGEVFWAKEETAADQRHQKIEIKPDHPIVMQPSLDNGLSVERLNRARASHPPPGEPDETGKKNTKLLLSRSATGNEQSSPRDSGVTASEAFPSIDPSTLQSDNGTGVSGTSPGAAKAGRRASALESVPEVAESVTSKSGSARPAKSATGGKWVPANYSGRIGPAGSQPTAGSRVESARGANQGRRRQSSVPLEKNGAAETTEPPQMFWAIVEKQAAIAEAQVASKVASWTAERVRLEEEFARRAESNQLAKGHMMTGGINAQLNAYGESESYLSPYAELDHAAAAEAIRSLITPEAMQVRLAAEEQYTREVIAIRKRFADLGKNISTESLRRALAPVPDKPYIECVARLPMPGSQLVSNLADAKKLARLERPISHTKKRGKSLPIS